MSKSTAKPERLDVAAELEAMHDNQFETACADAGRAIGLLASRDFDQARELFDQASRRAAQLCQLDYLVRVAKRQSWEGAK